MGWILVKQGKLETGILQLQMAVTASPGVLDYHYHLAAALVQKGEIIPAREELQKILDTGEMFESRFDATGVAVAKNASNNRETTFRQNIWFFLHLSKLLNAASLMR